MDTKHSILYLDDEEQNLIAFQALLRKDYKVFTTTDAHEATEILSRENIAVIFSDQKMPEVSQHDHSRFYTNHKSHTLTLHNIHRKNHTFQIKIILITVKTETNYSKNFTYNQQ